MANPLKIAGKVTLVKKHDEGVYTLVIKPERKVPRFKPGQFLHLTVDEYDPYGGYWPESRVFSIASAPAGDTIELIYSVKGRYTSRMSSELQAGSRVWIKMPYGDFTIESLVKPGQDIVLVAGGTGISPYISYLRAIVDADLIPARKVHLIYGIRNGRHFLFPEVIKNCTDRDLPVDVDVFIEQETSLPPVENVSLLKGMITLEHLIAVGKRLTDAVYFLSGPPAMITSFSSGLLSSGIPQEHIKIDAWE